MKNKKNILIGGLLAVVLLLAVGYAAFATTLNIQGTSKIDSNWDVHIKDNGIVVDNAATVAATSVSHSKVNDLTASFNCNLTEPGVSTIDYIVTVENTGTFAAKLTGITKTGETDYIGVAINKGSLKTNKVIPAGSEDTITVTVSYKNVSTPPTTENDRTANITITLNFTQDTGANDVLIDQTFVPQYYRYGTDTVSIGQSYDTSTWATNPSTLNRDYYLGHDVDGSGNVTANYACFVINNTQYCMRGKDGSLGTRYTIQNIALLSPLKDAGTITCTTFSASNAECSSGSVGQLSTNGLFGEHVGVSKTVKCYASPGGDSKCTE